ncbi:hypothetical protein Y032_0027g1585 [Ancylostoma ceylanicum]|uniref:ubiquitinyl hydrolase 1 n=1 Tax=Ancylostoma ceylanicum TaxID=53326 RepID=A0A016UUV9_9BILA|nr:hypothetical protein Y032_0027g1585 [Ancylostoma ceylanicum]
MTVFHKSKSVDNSDDENQRPFECSASGQGTTFKPRRRRNFNRESRPEHARRGSVSPGANSGDEYDVGFKDEKMDADFALLLKRTRGFEIRHVRGDGSCMFRAVADQLYGDQEMHGEVRRLCMDYMVRNRDHFAPFVAEDFSSYVARKRRPGQHGNHVELQAISEMFARPIEIYEYSENPRNIFYPTINALEVHAPIRLSYHGSSHYNSVVDPFAPAVGVGLGLPGYVARGANDLRQAVKESSDRSVEQALVQSQIALTDMERTEREISEQVARDSYLDYLARQAGEEQSSQKSSLYAELLALEECGGWPENVVDEDDELAQALSLSEQQYMEELQLRYGCEPEDTNNNRG